MIILESKPNNADIFINDKYESQTPFRIKNLLPNEYNIKVNKKKFNSWEKILPVESKKVTWASNIVLFYQNPKINKLSDINFNKFSVSPDYKNIIASSNYNDNSGLWLINIESRQSKKIYPKEENNNQNSPILKKDYKNLKYYNFKWSPNSEKVIFSIKNDSWEDILIVDINKKTEPIYINSSYDLKTKDIQWKNDEEIYLLDESGNIHQIELNLKYAPKIIMKNVINFKFSEKENKLIYISTEKNEFKLGNLVNDTKEKILNLPSNEKFTIEIGKYNNLALLLKNKKELLLINTETNEPKVIGNNITSFKWSKNKNKLLYFGENELWFYILKEENEDEATALAYNYNESNLLTRYSAEIKNAIWYPNEEYVAISLENSIKIIELDGRGKRNCQEYKSNLLAKDHFVEFDKKGEKIYLINDKNILQEIEATEF